jgi:hypothetical protein
VRSGSSDIQNFAGGPPTNSSIVLTQSLYKGPLDMDQPPFRETDEETPISSGLPSFHHEPVDPAIFSSHDENEAFLPKAYNRPHKQANQANQRWENAVCKTQISSKIMTVAPTKNMQQLLS